MAWVSSSVPKPKSTLATLSLQAATPSSCDDRRDFLASCSMFAAMTVAPRVGLAEEEAASVIQETKEKIVELLEKDESDEVKTEVETEQLIVKIEEEGKPNAADTKKLLVQLEKDEEVVEKETEVLIEKLQEIEQKAEKANVAILAEPDAKTEQAAAEASATETKEFIATLQERSTSNDVYITQLKKQVNDRSAMSDFLAILKDRVAANGDFLTKYDEFVARWKEPSR